jgi:hypothetical protein
MRWRFLVTSLFLPCTVGFGMQPADWPENAKPRLLRGFALWRSNKECDCFGSTSLRFQPVALVRGYASQ